MDLKNFNVLSIDEILQDPSSVSVSFRRILEKSLESWFFRRDPSSIDCDSKQSSKALIRILTVRSLHFVHFDFRIQFIHGESRKILKNPIDCKIDTEDVERIFEESQRILQNSCRAIPITRLYQYSTWIDPARIQKDRGMSTERDLTRIPI